MGIYSHLLVVEITKEVAVDLIAAAVDAQRPVCLLLTMIVRGGGRSFFFFSRVFLLGV